MGGFMNIGARPRPLPRALLVAASAAVLALVVLPTGARADHRVPPPACPPEVSLQGIERAPGGVILAGTVVDVTPAIGLVRVDVSAWYHRSRVPGLVPGEIPATVEVFLGPHLNATGRAVVSGLPAPGTRVFIAGTWGAASQSVRIACGVFADVATPIGSAWLERADMHYASVVPSPPGAAPAIPLDAPWLIVVAAAVALVLAAAALSAVADVRDPLPAT
jgi:hypothetical protein